MPDVFDQWENILKEAITNGVEKLGGPVPGALLRQLVEKAAIDHGLQYPPDDAPEIRFSQFLSKYPHVVVLHRRAAQDILVAPAGQAELLVDEKPTGKSLPGIRKDIFDAFTTIPGNARPWYSPSTDHFDWVPVDADPPPGDWIQVLTSSKEMAVEGRKRFSETIQDPEVKAEVLAALESPNFLRDFTNVIRNHNLQPEWHQFRTKIVVERIGEWAKTSNIPWRETWISTLAGRNNEFVGQSAAGTSSSREWRRALMLLVQSIDSDDLTRISIPLDIVLKVLEQRR